jgi:membrane fusion protein (multidrug efflux system)
MIKSRKGILVRTGIVVLVVLLLLFGIKFWLGYEQYEAMARRGPMRVSVSVSPVRSMRWQMEFHAVADIAAVSGVELTPQLAGEITAIDFHSGEYVHQGQLLLEIDNSNQRAQLASDRAALELAEVNYRRDRRLYAAKAASHSVLDTAVANRNSARAAVANDEATLQKLAFRAPFSGWIGVRDVSVGQYLTPGTPIAALNAWNPLRVQFTVPQNRLPQLHPGQTVRLTVDAYPGRIFRARVIALSSRVNPATRNVTVDANLPNDHDRLRPGMFGEVTIHLGKSRSLLVVPREAVTYSTFGDYVYVIQKHPFPGGHELPVAIATSVRVGATRGVWTPVLSGLKLGEPVVVAGQVKLRSGMPVILHPAAAH